MSGPYSFESFFGGMDLSAFLSGAGSFLPSQISMCPQNLLRACQSK